jgi:polar amino acid transport system substrate-binding protein
VEVDAVDALDRHRAILSFGAVSSNSITAALAPTGTLRAAINLGNPVLAQGDADDPAGVTVDLARELAGRLGVPVSFVCVDAARKSFEALRAGAADVGFLAIEPAREAEVAFTAPYVVIEGVYVAREDSPIATAAEVDRPGVRVGVNHGSAYDLYLTRTLADAEVVRGEDGIALLLEGDLDVAAGIRQPLARVVACHGGLRVLEPRFMEIRQAVATLRPRSQAAMTFLHDAVEELKAGGFVGAALERSGQDATVAPPG